MSESDNLALQGADPNELLRPDTFWELIENLLLNKTRDEQTRRRHNAALSALCRGHALPRVPRDQKVKRPVKYLFKTKEHGETTATKHTNANSNTLNEKSAHIKSNKSEVRPLKPEVGVGELHYGNESRSKSVNDRQVESNAKEAKSECRVQDHEIVYLKDTAVPESERLWRYAIKNRKRTEDEVWESSNDKKPIPNIRSNEAIYMGLRKRMEDREQQRKLRKEREKEGRIKRRHSCQHLQKIRSDMQVNKAGNAVSKMKRTPSVQNQHQFGFHGFSHNGIANGNAMPRKETGVPRTTDREEMFSPWGHDDAWSALTRMATMKTKEKFESKRALYNSVIKRRLSCGNQLESINKDIIGKKGSAHSVLGKETRRKYTELKSEYLNLCYQESTLRHQIALLHAEIYMMQNKGFHKTPASIKTITLDSASGPLHRSRSYTGSYATEEGALPMFPCLKAPRPLITSQQKQMFEKQMVKIEKKRPAVNSERKVEYHDSDVKYALPNIHGYSSCSPTHGVCSIYSITPQIVNQHR